MHTREIERRQWSDFLDGFSRQHEGWLVTVEDVPGGEGSSCVETRDLPLQGISIDRDGAISISVGDSADNHLTRTVDHPTRIIVEQTDAGGDHGLRINRDRDEATRVRFRSAARPEEVDGLP
jgi:hypothetical protein